MTHTDGRESDGADEAEGVDEVEDVDGSGSGTETAPGRATSRIGRLRTRRRIVTFAALVLLASIVPIPSASAPGAGGALLPLGIGLTAPFHLVGYAALAWLLTGVTGRRPRGLAAAAAIATGYGLGIELIQTVVPWRSFAWTDVLLNALGATVGVLGAGMVRLRRR